MPGSTDKEEYITQNQIIPSTFNLYSDTSIQSKRKRRAEYMKSYRKRQRNLRQSEPFACQTNKEDKDSLQHNRDFLKSVEYSQHNQSDHITQVRRIPSPETLDYCPYAPDVEIKEICTDNSLAYVPAQNDFAAILKRLEDKIDSIAADVKILKEITCQNAVTLDIITKMEPEA